MSSAQKIFLTTLLSAMALSANAYAAAKPQVVCMTKKGAIVIRAKCKKSETRQTLASITKVATETALVGPQGPQGAQGAAGATGPTGATGNPGAPGFINFSLCKEITVGPLSFAIAANKSATLTCTPTNTQFMLSHSFGVDKFASTTVKPYVAAEDLIMDGNVPVGLTYTFSDALNNNNFFYQIYAICCPRSS